MLVTLKEMLSAAEYGGYAVGLFNMLNLEMARGIIEAAEQERSPLILGVAEVHFPFIPLKYAAPIMRQIAREATVPVCLHFDHGVSYDKILQAMQNGFSSVMYDGSALSYEENAANTREVVKAAHALGISVEAELGHVGGNEDGSEDNCEQAYTDPDKVEDFIGKTDIDALAVAIGTAHGTYKKPPVLDINRLKEIYKISSKPLVLHGGSGLSELDFKNVIAGGIRKVNICTEMCLAAHNAYADGYKKNISFEKTVTTAKDAIKQVVQEKMRLFGSSGKA